MALFSGQVATPRWNTGASETPLPSPPRKFLSFEGGDLQKSPPFLLLTRSAKTTQKLERFPNPELLLGCQSQAYIPGFSS